MKNFKINFVIILLLFSACSIKKKVDPNLFSKQIESLKAAADSDNDGISDELERRMGTNPLIADIPRISIGLVQDISIGAIFKPKVEMLISPLVGNNFSILKQEFLEVDANKGGDLDSLKVLRKKIVRNQYNHLRNIKTEKIDIIINDDLRTNILSRWTDEQYYPFMDSIFGVDTANVNESGKFVANIKVKITNAKNVTEISNISLKTFFYDYEQMSESGIYDHYLLKSSGSKERFKLSGNETFEPVTIYPLIANEIKSNDIYAKVLDRSEIGIKFTDYDYTNLGVQLNYGEVLSKVFDGDAKIIYSDGIKSEVFFVSPSLTLNDALLQIGKKITLSKDGDIYSINDIETTAKYPIDLDTITIDDLKKGIWSVFGDADNLYDYLKPQGLYVVAFSRVEDILRTSRKWTDIADVPLINSIHLENIYQGDEVLFEVQEIKTARISESVTTIEHERGSCPVQCSLFVDNFGRGINCSGCTFCSEIISTPTVVENGINISSSEISKWFSFKDDYDQRVDAKVFKYGSKIKIQFSSPLAHLRNRVKINFFNPDDVISSARNGVVGGSCPRPSYSNQSFTNKFQINGAIKVFGINKY